MGVMLLSVAPVVARERGGGRERGRGLIFLYSHDQSTSMARVESDPAPDNAVPMSRGESDPGPGNAKPMMARVESDPGPDNAKPMMARVESDPGPRNPVRAESFPSMPIEDEVER